jgi:hypothetical protein
VRAAAIRAPLVIIRSRSAAVGVAAADFARPGDLAVGSMAAGFFRPGDLATGDLGTTDIAAVLLWHRGRKIRATA